MFLSECSKVEVEGKKYNIHNKKRAKDLKGINTNNTLFYDDDTRQVYEFKDGEYSLYEKEGYGLGTAIIELK